MSGPAAEATRRGGSLFRVVLGAAVALAFLLAIVYVFGLRTDVGDVLPPYSTLRADPLGAKALYESLDRVPEVAVRRHFDPLTHLEPDRTTAVFFTGVRLVGDINALQADIAREFDRLMLGGARVVLTLHPEVRDPRLNIWSGTLQGGPARDPDGGNPPAADDQEEAAPDGGDEGEDDAGDGTHGDDPGAEEPAEDEAEDEAEEEADEEAFRAPALVRLIDRWGFELDFAPLVPGPDGSSFHAATVERVYGQDFPEELPWMSGLHFSETAPDWRVLYERGGHPVAIEREYGAGSFVVFTDSSLLSNEGLREWPAPALLAYLVGANRTVVFDEYLNGVRKTPGLMSLARRYGLHGFLVALFVLAGLTLWRNATSLVPPYSEAEAVARRQSQEGRSAAAGLVNLLRRSVPRERLLATCLAEWRKSAPARPGQDQRAEQAEAIVRGQPTRTEAEVLAAYREVASALQSRR